VKKFKLSRHKSKNDPCDSMTYILMTVTRNDEDKGATEYNQ